VCGKFIKKIKEARKPPYHFINQNLNRLWKRIHFDVCRKFYRKFKIAILHLPVHQMLYQFDKANVHKEDQL